MKQDLVFYLNQNILNKAKDLKYLVKSEAPNNERDLFNCGQLVVWNGQSDNTIFQDERVNFAFRAWHDSVHLKSGIDFNPLSEIELGRRQANMMSSSILADLVYCEISGQAEYFMKNGVFVQDQVSFTKNYLQGLIYG